MAVQTASPILVKEPTNGLKISQFCRVFWYERFPHNLISVLYFAGSSQHVIFTRYVQNCPKSSSFFLARKGCIFLICYVWEKRDSDVSTLFLRSQPLSPTQTGVDRRSKCEELWGMYYIWGSSKELCKFSMRSRLGHPDFIRTISIVCFLAMILIEKLWSKGKAVRR